MEEKIIILELEFEYENIKQKIYPTILKDEKDIVLVDCGYENLFPILIENIKKVGIDPKDITWLYLTHQDDDHMGAAFELKKNYPNIKIMTSNLEKEYITGERKNLRLIQGEKMLEILPSEYQEMGEKFCERMRKLKRVAVDKSCKIGEILTWCGGCEVIDTKGHTPGHTSLYIKNKKVLIVGDAGVVENSELVIANPQFCLDLLEAENSLKRIKNMDITKYICFHGGELKNK